ncbi:MAG: 50S ribosomal protein L29 [Casimicrobiaceae bacterium]
MRAKEARDLSDQELTSKVTELQEALFRFRLRRGTNQLENPAALGQTRRDIARIRTIQAERQRAAAAGGK